MQCYPMQCLGIYICNGKPLYKPRLPFIRPLTWVVSSFRTSLDVYLCLPYVSLSRIKKGLNNSYESRANPVSPCGLAYTALSLEQTSEGFETQIDVYSCFPRRFK